MLDLEIEATEVVVPKTPKTRVTKPIPEGGVSGATLRVAKAPVVNTEKDKFNAFMDKDLLERAKNICFFTANVTLTDMVTEGLRIVVDRMENENNGPFMQRTGKLKTGRKKKIVSTTPVPKLEPVQTYEELTGEEIEVDIGSALDSLSMK